MATDRYSKVINTWYYYEFLENVVIIPDRNTILNPYFTQERYYEKSATFFNVDRRQLGISNGHPTNTTPATTL